MKIAFVDAALGLSGDMIVGALLQLGVPLEALHTELAKLPLTGCRVDQTEHRLHGLQVIACTIDEVSAPFSELNCGAARRMIQDSSLLEPVKKTSLDLFARLAEAASRVYGIAPEEVKLAQLGGVPAIIETVGTVFGLQTLGVDKVYASSLPFGIGGGASRGQTVSNFDPVTVELLKGLRIHFEEDRDETLTPAGAAIISGVAEQGAVPHLQLTAVGYGVRERRNPGRFSLLRVFVGNTAGTLQEDELLVLETNIDDLNPEFYEYVMERLFAAGARDVFLLPVQMKKNRPGVLLWVLCDRADRDKLTTLIFVETSTLGVRSYPVSRIALRREQKGVMTPYGQVRVKVAYGPGTQVNVAPEYEDCKRLARAQRIPLKLVYEAALYGARKL